MTKRLLFLLFMCIAAFTVQAQGTMSDEQIISYVITENEKGTSSQQIVTQLMQRGVTIEQLKRVKTKYEKEKKSELLGVRDISGVSSTNKRVRQNNGKTKEDDGAVNRRKVIEENNTSELSERRKRMLQQNKEDDYLDELDFLLPDSMQLYEDIISGNKRKKKGPQIFGRNIFNQKNLTFEPNMNIATPANYILGPGDEVYIDIWGASQKSIELTISPEGTIDVEGYGPIGVSGMSVEEANSRLKTTLGSNYANSQIRLTVGQTRTIAVNVMGEVELPGTYTLSAFATVFHALYMAGGVNQVGTLRDIKVFRNNRLISTIDIYDYILNGKLSGNIKLFDNDVIMVGTYDCLVNIVGKVKRPMFYEMKQGETVETLLRYSGGFAGDAYQDNIRLIRKSSGQYSVFTINEFERSRFKLADGDSLSIDSVVQRYSNMIEIKGAVHRPGLYQVGSTIQTVREFVVHSGGLTEDAFTSRALLHRRKPDRTLEVIPIDVQGVLDNKVADIPLCNEDVLFIPSLKELQEERIFTIYGEVMYPGTYQYAENTTIEDLVLQAGGLKDAASIVKIDVSRRLNNNKALTSNNTIARTFSFSLKDGFVVDGTPGYVLSPFDEIYVRKSPGYTEQQHVIVEGEVAFSGVHTLTEKNQRLSDIILESAGGLSKAAYARGARLERKATVADKLKQQSMLKVLEAADSLNAQKIKIEDSYFVGIDLYKALENRGSDEWDIVLKEGDRIIVPQYSNTVTISGEVMHPNTVSYTKSKKLIHYIQQAGGYSQMAKKSRVYVVQMNGTVSRARKAASIQPGCEIIVPAKPKRKNMSMAEIIGLGTISASLASVIAILIK